MSAQSCKGGAKVTTVRLENSMGDLDGKRKEDKPLCLFILPYYNGRLFGLFSSFFSPEVRRCV